MQYNLVLTCFVDIPHDKNLLISKREKDDKIHCENLCCDNNRFSQCCDKGSALFFICNFM